MSLVIHGDSRSGNCLKVKWLVRALGLAATWVEVSVVRGETRTPAFLALNPAGQVPVAILPDGRALSQSNAILLHLAETAGAGRFIPADPFLRARMYEWLFWEQYTHEPAIAVRRYHKAFLGKDDADIDPRLKERGEAALALLEGRLGAAPTLVDGGVSLADLALVAYTRVADEGGFDLAARPGVRAWIARVEDRFAIATDEGRF